MSMIKAKGFVRLSIWQLFLPWVISFVFSLITVGIFFIEGIHITDNWQPFLAVFIVLFWGFFWMIVLLKFLGIRIQNR